ncbi:MAG TPA: M23 family metallopeptidase [Anaeromyxobacteraceae bacterium]|nr:M23 family metallopeptidase [Anaeromyxobacteraceae bacterium]
MTPGRLAPLVAALVLGCATAPPPRPPPVPLTSAEPHVEPDLIGSLHVVKKGETVYRIARTYGIEVRDLMEVNDLADPRQLEVGRELFIPGAVRPLDVPPLPPGVMPEPEPEPQALPRAPPADPSLRWPLHGVLYSRFGVRQGQRHDGIDIAAPEGTPVVAAAAGTVVYTGRQSGYGAIVILRHQDGLVTLYAHNSEVLVKEGDRVEAGAPIARVGQSGRTTGPHLHFEVRQGTRPRNPLFYLP